MFYKIIVFSVIIPYFKIFPEISSCLRTHHHDSYHSRIDTDLKHHHHHGESKHPLSGHHGHDKRKYFPLFATVVVPPSQCIGKNGEIGLCVRSRHGCKSENGIDSGKCALGYGTCCIQTRICKSSEAIVVNSNQTHLISTRFQKVCRYEIPKPKNVCQIRLDFLQFKIDEGPNVKEFGDCVTDTFMVSGATNSLIGPLCGDLTGQHMYLNYGTSERINLDFYLKTDLSQKWDILLSTIRCDSLQRAPDGCLQFFTTQRGTVKSFNYNLKHQLNNQEYSICIKTNPGMKKITWETCGYPFDFVITNGLPAPLGDPSLPGGAIGESVSGSNCQTDWIMFLGDNKYCGNVLPTSHIVSTTSQPFIAHVHFNNFEVPLPPECPQTPNPNPEPRCQSDIENTGFCLQYSQSV